MKPTHSCLLLTALLACLLSPKPVAAQSFDETWKEFLEERKVSNINGLGKPDKATDKPDYAKYLLMNANSRFCQSDEARAQELTTELTDMGPRVYEGIPGFAERLSYLQEGYRAYATVDSMWAIFLRTDDVPVPDLEAVTTVRRLCEKGTMAKYTFMLAHGYYCLGELPKAKNIFENRTLRLAEKTSLKISDIEGLPERVRTMKALFTGLESLDVAWDRYLASGESPGFDTELPLVPCNPAPNVKAAVLRGLADACGDAAPMYARIQELTGGDPESLEEEIAASVRELEGVVNAKSGDIKKLDAAWTAFLADDKVDPDLPYGYEYCEKEPLIRAYLLDGYTFVCDYAQHALKQIDSLQSRKPVRLSPEVRAKIEQLAERHEEYLANGTSIEEVWSFFVVNDDQLLTDYESTTRYCDHVHEIKDWTMRGLTGDCDQALEYLTLIEDFNAKFDFKFYPELECRIQKLRIRIYDCRYDVVRELAELESTPETYESRLAELMEEYALGERPGVCEEQE